MFKFDNEEKVISLIMEETDYNKEMAEETLEELKETTEELHPYIKAWQNGEKPKFEFYGLSSDEMLELTMGVDSYIDVVIEMDGFLKSEDTEGAIRSYRAFGRGLIK